MAKVSSATRDVQFSEDDLRLLAKSFEDEKFRGLLGEFAKELNDPIKQKQYENEVKEWQKQGGVDVVFVDPSPGFVVAVVGGGDVDPVCLNICSSDVIQEPSLIKRKDTASLGYSWSIPHAVTVPRKEVISGEKQLLRELLKGRVAKKSQQSSSSQLKQVFVYDVVFHPDTLHLAFNNSDMKRCVIHSAMESVSKNYQLKVGNQKEISSVDYVGKPMKSVIKKVVDQELNENTEKLCYLKKAEDERTSVDTDNTSNKADNQSTNAVKDEERTMTPQYTIKHVNKVDLQDFALPLIPQSGPAWRPQALEVEVQLRGVLRASQVNAEVWQQSLTLSTDPTPVYKLKLPLPYPVDEDLSTAKFDVSTQNLTFVLSVIPASKKDFMPLPSPSSDSGIECEPGYRTNSDGDNSSEVSVSSQEDGSRDEDDDNSVFESAPSSPIKATLIPSYVLKQTEEDIHVTLNCGSILPSSVSFIQRNEKVRIQLSSIGGGQTRLNYGLTLVSSPHKFKESSISHQINDDNMEITIRKATTGLWQTCQIGDGNCLATVNVETLKQSTVNTKTKTTAMEFAENAAKDDVTHKNVECVARKPRVVRAVSMCEGSPASPDIRFKGPTCSWPRGILKHRSRSLSESYLGTFSPLESMGSLEFSLDLDILDDRDTEESTEENLAFSLGEKKSVRFNDVVSRQLFRTNSSILGQKARKQKRNLNKKKRRERRQSESDRDSDITQSYSDPGPSNGDLSGTTTTSDDDDDDEEETEVEENVNDLIKSASRPYDDLDNKNINNKALNRQNTIHHNDNDNSNNNNNINNNNNDNENDTGVKTSKKKRKNNKKKDKKFEPTNNLIFQLDIEP